MKILHAEPVSGAVCLGSDSYVSERGGESQGDVNLGAA